MAFIEWFSSKLTDSDQRRSLIEDITLHGVVLLIYSVFLVLIMGIQKLSFAAGVQQDSFGMRMFVVIEYGLGITLVSSIIQIVTTSFKELVLNIAGNLRKIWTNLCEAPK